MAKPRPWTVLPHDPLVRFEDNLWGVQGDLPGMPLRRRMLLIRLNDGRVVIHNGIPVDEATMKEIETLGPGRPSFLIVPNGFHRLDAHAFKERYPDIRVLCPSKATARVKQIVPIDGNFDSLPADLGLRGELIAGAENEAAFIVTSGPDKRATLIFTDAVFNQPHLGGSKGFVVRLIGSTGGPKVTPVFRLFVLKNRPALKEHLARLAEIPNLHRIIVAHGDVIEGNARSTLSAVAAAL